MKHFVKKSLAVLSVVFVVFMGMPVHADVAVAASGDATVYITKTGECYHADGCSSLRKSKIAVTLKDAVDRGYRPCSKCKPVSLEVSSTDASSTVKSAATTTTTTAATTSPEIEALKTYKGNTAEFNAYSYYINNVDLQTSIGTDGDKLLEHYNNYGKAEGRVAK